MIGGRRDDDEPDGGGGDLDDLKVVVTIGPRLCGNCSGRGRE